MLKGTNNERLIGSGLKEEHLLFYQIWKELTESKTFDTYQYKSVNILNGICELVHDIESYLDGNTHTMHTIDAMREELLALIKRDSVMVGEFPSLRNRLLQSLSKKLDSTSRLKGLWYQLKYVYSKLESAYDEALTKKLVEAIETGADTQYQLTAQYISRCVDMGWFVKALSTKADTLKQEPARSKGIDSFLFKLIKAQKQNFSVFAPFRLKVVPKDGKSKEEYREAVIRHLSSFGIEVKTGIEIEGFCVGIEKAELKDTQQYMVVQTQAYDVFSAAHFSIIGLSEVLNTLSFFTAIESWSVSDISLIVYNTQSPYTKSLKATDVYRTYEYLDSSSKVYERAERIISPKGHCGHPLRQKLLSSFSYANLSRASMALEEKYMNIWIAIESLCRSDAQETIIDSILTLVPNALCLRYLYRLVRNFVEDCSRCDVEFVFSTKSIDMKMGDKDRLVTETIAVFRDTTLQPELEEKCRCNSLLHQRYQEMFQILTDPQTLIDKVEKHHTTVRWHLNRLYRVRNEIAHSGVLQEISAIRYTEHLYDYLATLVSEVTRFSAANATGSLGEIFSLINDNYMEFYDLSRAKQTDKPSVLGKLWTSGVMDFL